MRGTLKALHEAWAALAMAGVRDVAITLDKGSYLSAFAQAVPGARDPKPGARAFVVWERPFVWRVTWDEDGSAMPAATQVWLTPGEEKEFKVFGLRVCCGAE